MNKHFINNISGFWALILLPALAACSKSIGTVEDPRVSTVEIQAKTVDAFRLKVTANDIVLTDNLATPTGTQSANITFLDPNHRFRLYDVFANRLIFDTVISVKTTKKIVLFQPGPGRDIIWIGPPPATEPLPPVDSMKMSMIYTYEVLPDMVKVVVENSIGTSNNYTATDSFPLAKGDFSRYFLGNKAGKGKQQLKLYTTDGSRKLVATWLNILSSSEQQRFYIYACRSGSLSGGVYTLTADKLY